MKKCFILIFWISQNMRVFQNRYKWIRTSTAVSKVQRSPRLIGSDLVMRCVNRKIVIRERNQETLLCHLNKIDYTPSNVIWKFFIALGHLIYTGFCNIKGTLWQILEIRYSKNKYVTSLLKSNRWVYFLKFFSKT